MENVEKVLNELYETVQDSIAKGRLIPSLILIYSGIDSFSNLVNREGNSGRKVFKDWVKRWMMADDTLKCNESDLYSARCAVLHQFNSESDLSKEGNAREIYYSFGASDLSKLQDWIDTSIKQNKAIAVRVEDLLGQFKKGVANCIIEINNDSEWLQKCKNNTHSVFATIIF